MEKTEVEVPPVQGKSSATVEEEPATFTAALSAEWAEVRRRRGVWSAPRDGSEEPRMDPAPLGLPPENLVGLALSGGGIRSATFALGMLQTMSRLGVLKAFDYLSTVSGGGYTGGWWSAWLSRPERKGEGIFPAPERVEPERWPEYVDATRSDDEGMPDASLSARRNDPIHHLRLFANYLTPRKGALSADTWRGATVVTRNLLLTWLVLLPLLLAVVVAGQIYFTLGADPERNFLGDFAPAAAAAPAALAVGTREMAVGEPVVGASPSEAALEQAHLVARQERLAAIRERGAAAARPLVVLVIWIALLTLVWMVHGSGSSGFLFVSTLAGAVAALFIGWTLYGAMDGGGEGAFLPVGWTYLLSAGAIVLLVGCRALPTYLFRARGRARAVPADLLRNRVVRVHGAVLVGLVLLGLTLLVAGFSHDLLWYLFDPASGGPLPSWVKQTGGWGAVLATVGAMLFTGFKGAPAGGGGDGQSRPGTVSRFLFAIAPVLTVTLLAILASTAGRALITQLGDQATDLERTDTALLVAVALFIGFAIYETLDGEPGRSIGRGAAVPLVALAAGLLFFALGPNPSSLTLGSVVLACVAGAVLLGVRWWGVLRAEHSAGTSDRAGTRPPATREERRHRLSLGSAVAIAALGGLGLILMSAVAATPHVRLRGASWLELELARGPGSFSLLLLAAALACGVFAAAEQLLSPSRRRRSVALLTVALAALATRAVLPFLPLERAPIAYTTAAATLVVLALAWVVGLGWMANPNMLSLHAFYKARLVRAYMGASNPERRTHEITESAVGDDVALEDLANCERGAPYHLINTTLNLVGGRDLSTAQRSADGFVMSKHYCGSARTGYRPTREYMEGRLTLGTAVAISGAAASPNMGSMTPTAALSMLLALLNVRLAFWAPTPNRPLWRDSRPRLWPFYLLREFLSQTHELSPYCCLSDGGHFDNTGLYSLVARGCRYVVVSDCGADPLPCFQDIGNAIRRCRIDFGTEIELGIDDFLHAPDTSARAHFTVGTITYSSAHARALGWPGWEDPKQRRGVVIWIKPSLTRTGESADLRQYALQNPVFPQQSTADQWYDEAQFESYRRLGEYTAQQVFGGVEVPATADPAVIGTFFEDFLTRDSGSPGFVRIDQVAFEPRLSTPNANA